MSFIFIGNMIVYYYLVVNQGLGTKVYKKEWVTANENSQTLEMHINIPKYSRDTIGQYKFKSKFLDFLGITISSAALKITYLFKLIDE